MNFIIFLNSFIIYSPIHNSTNFQLMTNLSANCDGKNPSPSSDEFAQCVENISVLNLRLKNADERCQLLKADLRQAKQVCEIDFTIDFVKSISRNFREIDFLKKCCQIWQIYLLETLKICQKKKQSLIID